MMSRMNARECAWLFAKIHRTTFSRSRTNGWFKRKAVGFLDMSSLAELEELHSALDATIAENSTMRNQMERLRDEHIYFSSILSQSTVEHPALLQLAAARNGAHLRATQESAVRAAADVVLLRNKLAKRDAALAASEERRRQLEAKVAELTQHIGSQFSAIQEVASVLETTAERKAQDADIARSAADGVVRELQATLTTMRLEAARHQEQISRLISENRSLRAESGHASATIVKLQAELATLKDEYLATKLHRSASGSSVTPLAPVTAIREWQATTEQPHQRTPLAYPLVPVGFR